MAAFSDSLYLFQINPMSSQVSASFWGLEQLTFAERLRQHWDIEAKE
jgi:hypothetical protein